MIECSLPGSAAICFVVPLGSGHEGRAPARLDTIHRFFGLNVVEQPIRRLRCAVV